MTLTIKKAQLTAVVICGNRGDTDQRPDRWQGPPQINKIKQNKLQHPLRSVCLEFIQSWEQSEFDYLVCLYSVSDDRSLLINISSTNLQTAPLISPVFILYDSRWVSWSHSLKLFCLPAVWLTLIFFKNSLDFTSLKTIWLRSPGGQMNRNTVQQSISEPKLSQGIRSPPTQSVNNANRS